MNSIKFLGTGGARFVVTRQIRRSGGLWLKLDETEVLIDPGPGSLLRCLSSRPKLNPLDLDGIILTHRHLDHSNDVNIMIEAMTNGGFKKRGVVFAPSDTLGKNPVILKHVRNHVDKIEKLYEKGKYTLGNISFSTPKKHIHGVETYGLNFFGEDISISLIADTEYFDGLEKYYTGDVLIINVVRFKRKEGVQHLCVEDVEKILSFVKPKKCVITHFGMTMLKAKPWEVASNISDETGVDVVAARDGMTFNLDDL